LNGTLQLVIAGLDPAIHPFSKMHFVKIDGYAGSSPRMTTVIADALRVLCYAAGTGSAVTDLIFSIAKREVTFLSETAPISFL
jgi:hypothetical protein